jgi:hypothetical protein
MLHIALARRQILALHQNSRWGTVRQFLERCGSALARLVGRAEQAVQRARRAAEADTSKKARQIAEVKRRRERALKETLEELNVSTHTHADKKA